MPPSGDVVNDAAIPFLLPSRLSGRSISLSRNAAGARAAGRNLFGKRQHVQTAQHQHARCLAQNGCIHTRPPLKVVIADGATGLLLLRVTRAGTKSCVVDGTGRLLSACMPCSNKASAWCAMAFTGWAIDHSSLSDSWPMEEIHETLANILTVLVVLHLLALGFMSWWCRFNYLKTMKPEFHGRQKPQ